MRKSTTSSWDDFLKKVRTEKKKLGNPEIVWFRGHWNHNHYLLPSLLRYKNGIAKEQMLFHKLVVLPNE